MLCHFRRLVGFLCHLSSFDYRAISDGLTRAVAAAGYALALVHPGYVFQEALHTFNCGEPDEKLDTLEGGF